MCPLSPSSIPLSLSCSCIGRNDLIDNVWPDDGPKCLSSESCPVHQHRPSARLPSHRDVIGGEQVRAGWRSGMNSAEEGLVSQRGSPYILCSGSAIEGIVVTNVKCAMASTGGECRRCALEEIRTRYMLVGVNADNREGGSLKSTHLGSCTALGWSYQWPGYCTIGV